MSQSAYVRRAGDSDCARPTEARCRIFARPSEPFEVAPSHRRQPSSRSPWASAQPRPSFHLQQSAAETAACPRSRHPDRARFRQAGEDAAMTYPIWVAVRDSHVLNEAFHQQLAAHFGAIRSATIMVGEEPTDRTVDRGVSGARLRRRIQSNRRSTWHLPSRWSQACSNPFPR